tara:strand:- start:3286 stop:4968 length:1683 start_codon:yes stop_codon:yes gene_type:complete
MSLPDLTAELRRPGVDPSTLGPDAITQLKPLQSAALHAIRAENGGFIPVGVGEGKTFIGILAGSVMSNVKWVFYMGPSGGGALVAQIRGQVFQARRLWKVIPSGALKVHTYSELSSAKGTNALSRWMRSKDPKTVLFVWDEAHKLKDPTASRTKRVKRLFKEYPAVRHVFMSGTLISRSLKDGAHLAHAALGDRSPLPIGAELTAWASVMDHDGIAKPAQEMIVRRLQHAFGDPKDASAPSKAARARLAFSRRLRSAPGVVMSSAGTLDCSSYIRYVTSGPVIPDDLQEMIEDVDLVGPDGEPLESDAHAAQIRAHLTAGFYYVPDWGKDGPDEPWLDAKREWNRQVRAEAQYHSQEHYDSPLLIAGALSRYHTEHGHAPTGREVLWDALVDWRVQKERRPRPPPNMTIRVSDYLIDHLMGWLRKQKKPCLIWYGTKATAEALERAGVFVVRAGDEVPKGRGKHMALSIAAHGTGIDGLQLKYDTQWLIEPMTGADIWEQWLGRLLRIKQASREVWTYVYKHAEPFAKAVNKARALARNDEEKLQMAQKILYSDSADITV